MNQQSHERHADAGEHFSSSVAGLPSAVGTDVVDLADGDTIDLRIAPVAKRLGEATVRMLAYNGSIPGPTLRVREGSHAGRERRQRRRPRRDRALARPAPRQPLRRHARDAGADSGRRGVLRTASSSPTPASTGTTRTFARTTARRWGSTGTSSSSRPTRTTGRRCTARSLLTLDDVLIEDGRIAPFSRTETNYAAMGRFGNVMLVGGETDLSLVARAGEVVRFYLTNTANTRVFNVALPGARMKLVGGDSGRCEREAVRRLGDPGAVGAGRDRRRSSSEPGRLTLEHRTPRRTYPLATIDVGTSRPSRRWRSSSERSARTRSGWPSGSGWRRTSTHRPTRRSAFVAEMDMGAPEGRVVYACPMHPDVVRTTAGRCPKCGMKLLATAAPQRFACPMHPDVVSDTAGRCPKCGMKLLPASKVAQPAARSERGQTITATGTTRSTRISVQPDTTATSISTGRPTGSSGKTTWSTSTASRHRRTCTGSFVDRETGAVNHAIDWRFRVGDQVKLRLVNEMDSDHPMHHPFHVHGAGRFVVLARDGVTEQNLVWKDTVLVRTGETVDILLDVTNPGIWMAHCHIAEHHESGMMFSFTVAPSDAR